MKRCRRPTDLVSPALSLPGAHGLLVAIAAGCGDPPVPLPVSSPLPVDRVHLGMTFHDLREVRDIMVVPDTGVVEELFGGRYHYGFTATPPRRRSRLVYVDRVRDELEDDYARQEWDTLVAALAAELEVEPRCAAIEYARLRWRRAMLQEEGRPVAAAVEVVSVTTGDAGPGEAQLITRVWLTAYPVPVARFLKVPEGVESRLPQWEACGSGADP